MKQIVRLILLAVFITASSITAAATPEFVITIKDHKFHPAEVTVPANTKIRLIVKNEDATPEEFESHRLHREKVIQGKSKAIILVGPLKPGKYPFVGEFHEDTCKGVLIAR